MVQRKPKAGSPDIDSTVEVVQSSIDGRSERISLSHNQDSGDKNSTQGGKVSVSSGSKAANEQLFGLRRMSFLLPEELANEFEERGGEAWLMSVLRDEQQVPESTNPAEAVAVKENDNRREAPPAKDCTYPDIPAQYQGRRRNRH